MAYNTVVIKKDADNKPVPQYYNPVTDEYEVLQGTGGAARQVLYGPDGNPLSVVDNKLAVRATELEEKLEAVRVLLNTLAGEDFATQTTLAQILGKMIAAPATEAKQDSLATLVGAIEDKLDGVIDGTTPAKTQLTGSLVQVGDKEYPVSSGSTLRGKAADKPDAAAAHAVIPYCYYFSIDTGVVEATDGTSWAVI